MFYPFASRVVNMQWLTFQDHYKLLFSIPDRVFCKLNHNIIAFAISAQLVPSSNATLKSKRMTFF